MAIDSPIDSSELVDSLRELPMVSAFLIFFILELAADRS